MKTLFREERSGRDSGREEPLGQELLRQEPLRQEVFSKKTLHLFNLHVEFLKTRIHFSEPSFQGRSAVTYAMTAIAAALSDNCFGEMRAIVSAGV